MSGRVDRTESCESDLRRLIITISQDMTTSDREVIVTYTAIPAAQRERITSNMQLWAFLHDRADFDYCDETSTLAFLRRILDPSLFRHNRLLNHVLRYCGESPSSSSSLSSTPSPSPSSERPTEPPVLPSYSGMEIAFKYLSECLGHDWKPFLRELLTDHHLSQLEHDTRFDPLSEKIRFGLRRWQQRTASVTVDDLIDALRRCKLNLHADEIELRLREPSYPTTVEY